MFQKNKSWKEYTENRSKVQNKNLSTDVLSHPSSWAETSSQAVILLASHSPDMISALRYIAAKEKTQDTLVFYHAERVDSTNFGKYQFKSLGLDIEEIFSSL